MEFKEYATEVDVDFVRKAVRAIGRCAIKLERAAERCISVLLELIKIKVNYVVQEAIIVIKDIFRRYPNTYVHFSTCVLQYNSNIKIMSLHFLIVIVTTCLLLESPADDFLLTFTGMNPSLPPCVRAWTL